MFVDADGVFWCCGSWVLLFGLCFIDCWILFGWMSLSWMCLVGGLVLLLGLFGLWIRVMLRGWYNIPFLGLGLRMLLVWGGGFCGFFGFVAFGDLLWFGVLDWN